jgi:hypothetical protein
LQVVPSAAALASQPIGPPASGAGGWTVTRTIQLEQAQFCNGLFATRGPLTCGDTFTITSLSSNP